MEVIMNDFENEVLENNTNESEILSSLINHFDNDQQGGSVLSDPFTMTILNLNKEIA